jgi:hypothetical protein
MHHRVTPTRIFSSTIALIAATLGASPLAAQSKVLTPPRRDTTRTQVARPSAPGAPGTVPPTAAAPAPAVIPQSAVLDSIREVVFRNLLDRDRAGFATLASAFCLGLSTSDFKKADVVADRADAPEAMVRRLASPRTPARRASTCTFAPNGSAARSVAGRALLYSVGAIEMISPERAEAGAAYNYDGYSAGGFTFSVERTDSAWVVKQWRMEWTAKPTGP